MSKRVYRCLTTISLALTTSWIAQAENAWATEPPTTQDPAQSNDELAEKVRVLASDHDYRDAMQALDTLLARPGGEYNLVLQGWLATRYGDVRRGSSVLLPILAKKTEFVKHVDRGFEPLIAGSLAYYTGDHDQAHTLLRKAVDQYEFAPGRPGHVYAIILQALDILGQLHRNRGEHRAAAECIEQMRAVLRFQSNQPANTLLPDLHQGELYLAKGETSKAAESLKQVERYLESSYAIPKTVRARILMNMGLVATRRGELREAERLLQESLVWAEKVYIDFHPAIVRTLRHLTNLYVLANRPREALALADRAAELADKRARHVLSLGSERQKRLVAQHIANDTNTIVSLHQQYMPTDVGAARLALRTILRRKGMVFEAMLAGVSALRENLDDEGRVLAREFSNLSAQMSTMISRGPVDVTFEDYENDLFDLEEQRRTAEERLIAQINKKSKRQFDDAPLVRLEDVQAAIPEGAALVEIIEYRPHRPFGPPVHSTWGKPRMAAYVLHKTGDPTWVDLGYASVMTDLAKKWVEQISAGEQHRATARALDLQLMQPIRRALGNTRWIMLSPDGALNFIPFYALVDEHDRDLVESMSITYLMTGRDLLRLGHAGAPAKQSPVIVANPDFGQTIERETNARTSSRGSGVELSHVFFSQLAGTEQEGHEVQKRLTDARLLEGTTATEETLKELHGPSVLHIATHGFFLPDITNVTADASKTGPDPWNANPLLRSGLALVGANRRKSQTEREDGVLTALEVSNLDLRGTQLVVLSACETGVGQALRGEGVYGLQRAMMIAGAQTQVTSLWQVDDLATKNMMVKYYENLAQGAGRGEGMRLAQLSVRQAYAHPRYWASFVVTGNNASLDGKNLPPDPKNFQVLRGRTGCGCEMQASEGSEPNVITLGILGTLWIVRRKRMQRKSPACS